MEAYALEDVVHYVQEHLGFAQTANVELWNHNFYIREILLVSPLTLAVLKIFRMSYLINFLQSSFLTLTLEYIFPK